MTLGYIGMFSIFGLISNGGERVVEVVVYEGTSCLEKLSRIYSLLTIQPDKTKKMLIIQNCLKPQP